MGKVTYEGLRKPDDPIYRQQSIVIGGLRGKKKPAKSKSEKSPRKSQKP